MGSFRDQRLLEDIERGASGGPRFKTTVIQLSSGHERRNVDWERVRCEYDISYGIQEHEDFHAVRNFFMGVAQGQAYSFRFRDWSDYEIPDRADETPQSIGTGDGVVVDYQIVKTYTFGSYTYSRIIEKPLAGTLRVYLDSVEQMSGWNADYDTGIITFTSPPGVSADVGIICQYDVPVRFTTDSFSISLEQITAGSIPSLDLIEVRGETI